jgi:hypothetical protein
LLRKMILNLKTRSRRSLRPSSWCRWVTSRLMLISSISRLKRRQVKLNLRYSYRRNTSLAKRRSKGSNTLKAI